MRKLTVNALAINATLRHLLFNSATSVDHNGKIVTRHGEPLEFECDCECQNFTTENVMEAVEWLYCEDIDDRELFFLDQQFVDDVTEAAKKQAKREVLTDLQKGYLFKEMLKLKELYSMDENPEFDIMSDTVIEIMVHINKMLFELED